jgi:ArsR family transcriptional regulator, arsenate/arsenite/antimonite-responsive transcriptional repressor
MKRIDSLTPEEERAAAMFRALGNPARVRIVAELARRNACVTGDLVDVLPLAQSTVSQHLKVLKDAGIVCGQVEGDQNYCLDTDAIAWLMRFCEQVCGPGSCGPVQALTDAISTGTPEVSASAGSPA